MTVKSIIEIDVRDGSFNKFADKFRKYQEQLAKSKSGWNDVDLKIKGAKNSFDQMVYDMIVANEQAKKTAKAQEIADAATNRQARSWRDMARSTKDVASNIGKATSSLLRWTSLTAVVSGLLGAGGLFGIDRLAAGVAGSRRSAGGLGLSIGEQSAFEVNYGRLVNPSSFLGAVNEATSDASKRYTLYSAGLNEKDIAGKSTGDVATTLIQALKKKIDQTPTALLGQLLSTGLGQFIGLDEARRIKSRGPGELAMYGAGYGKDVSRLGLTDRDARLWENFVVKLDEAGKTIETGFIRKIAPLAPGLTSLSESITRTIESLFGDSKRLNKWIEQFGVGIETFGKYLGSEKFQTDVKSFADAVGSMAEKTIAALRWLGLIPGGESAVAAARPDHRNEGKFGYLQAVQRAVGGIGVNEDEYFYPHSYIRSGIPELDRGTLPLPRPRPRVLSGRVDQSFDDVRTGTNAYSAASESLRSGLQLRVRNMTDASVTLTPQTGSQTPVVLNQLPQ